MDARAMSRLPRRSVFTVIVGMALALLGGASCSGPRVAGGRPAPTAPTGTGAPSTVATTPSESPAPEPIEETDWAQTTVVIPYNTTGCEPGTAHFHNGTAMIAGTTYRMFTRRQKSALYSDFDGDDNTDAVISAVCLENPAADNVPAVLLVISGAADRHQLGMLSSTRPRNYDPNGNAEQEVQDLQLTSGPAVRFTLRNYEGTGRCTMDYFWRDGSFSHRNIGHGETCR